jgi:predicted amidophosphoribosyltransferase
LRVWIRAAIDLLFPAQCAGCDAIGAGVCVTCVPEICKALSADADAGIPIRAFGTYEGALRRAILALKDGRRDIAESLARRLATLLEPNAVLIPVPTTAARCRVRGLDGVAEIASIAAGLTGGESRRVLLQRAGDAQRGRTRRERLATRERFACREGVEIPRTAVLIDDVCTTGATLRDCRAALEGAGTHVSGAVVVAAAKSGAACFPHRNSC